MWLLLLSLAAHAQSYETVNPRTVTFEDMKSIARSDLDYNDLTLRYQAQCDIANNNDMVAIEVHFAAVAAGAELVNQLWIVPPAAVASATLSQDGTPTTPPAVSGSNPIELFSNFKDAFSGSPSGFVNTVGSTFDKSPAWALVMQLQPGYQGPCDPMVFQLRRDNGTVIDASTQVGPNHWPMEGDFSGDFAPPAEQVHIYDAYPWFTDWADGTCPSADPDHTACLNWSTSPNSSLVLGRTSTELTADAPLDPFATCIDGKQDGTETGPDCGDALGLCPPCPVPVYVANGQNASVVLGEPDFTTKSCALTRSGLGSISGNPDVIGGALYVSDSAHTRILGFTMPLVSGADAAFVLGAPDFTTAGTLGGTVDTDGSSLYVPQGGYSSKGVEVFQPIPTALTTPPIASMPSPAFIITPPPGQTLAGPPVDFSVGGGRMVMADPKGNRVLLWDAVPTSGSVPADRVLGQPDFTSTVVDQPGGVPTDSNLNTPQGVWTDGTHIAVIDSNNNRVLIWNSWPTQIYDQPANLELGQLDFSGGSPNRGAGVADDTFSSPGIGIYGNAGELLVSDTFNGRVLIWYAWPTSDGQPADAVLGKPGFSGGGTGPTQSLMQYPDGLYVSGTKIFVGDGGSCRVLVYDAAECRTDADCPGGKTCGSDGMCYSGYAWTDTGASTATLVYGTCVDQAAPQVATCDGTAVGSEIFIDAETGVEAKGPGNADNGSTPGGQGQRVDSGLNTPNLQYSGGGSCGADYVASHSVEVVTCQGIP